nr:PREDICTED: uncharacterized protein LOC109036744 isoform X3 [Bemisia tabaci]
MSIFPISDPPMPEEARNLAFRNAACRLCDKPASPKKRFLFKEWRDKKVNTLIENVIGIKMKYHPNLSNSICETCYEKLSSFDGFVKCVIANQVLFSQNLHQVIYEVVPINRMKPVISASKKTGRKPKHELDIIESYIENLKRSKKQKRANSEFGFLRVKPPEELQANHKLKVISTHKPSFSSVTFERVPPAPSIESVYIKEEPQAVEDGIFPDSPPPASRASSSPQPQAQSLWCEISAVRSCSSQSGRTSQPSSKENHQNNHEDSSDSDVMILDDEVPSKKPRLSRTGGSINCKAPEKHSVTLEPIVGPCRMDLDISVKQEKLDDPIDDPSLVTLPDPVDSVILPDPVTSVTLPDPVMSETVPEPLTVINLPITIKQEVDLENGAPSNISPPSVAPVKLPPSVAPEHRTQFRPIRPKLSPVRSESENPPPKPMKRRLYKPATKIGKKKAPSSVEYNDDISCLPCYRCKKENESYLNLLYHHINYCSTEVSEEDPVPPLQLIPEALKEQCAMIQTDEETLLRKIYLEMNECMKNFPTLRDYYKKMINLTRPVVVSYCKKYNIKLDIEEEKSN